MIQSLAPVQGLWIFHDVLRFWSQSVQVHLVHPLKRFSSLSICQFKHEILFNEIYHLYCNCMIIRRGYVFTGLRSRERQFIFIRWHLFFKTISKKQWTGQWMSSKKKKSQKKLFLKSKKSIPELFLLIHGSYFEIFLLIYGSYLEILILRSYGAVIVENNENWLIAAFYEISWQGRIWMWLISFLVQKVGQLLFLQHFLCLNLFDWWWLMTVVDDYGLSSFDILCS